MSSSDQVKLIVTGDGSHSLYNDHLRETYHSTRGAIQESEHVFINAGLLHSRATPVRILEVGFGTGLNVLLSVLWSLKSNRPVFIRSYEAFPLPAAVIQSLNYGQLLNSEEWFQKIHEQGWNEPADYKNGISIEKILANWRDTTVTQGFDIVFYDAFAPSKQPEMWDFDLIKKACDALNPKGIFVTYSATGQLKRDLAKAGMSVETLPGPPGKKEMVRAIKN